MKMKQHLARLPEKRGQGMMLLAGLLLLSLRLTAPAGAAVQDDEDSSLQENRQIYPEKESERTPENIRGYDLMPHPLSMTWESEETGLQIVGELIRAGSKTVTIKSQNRLHQIAWEDLTEESQRQARRFQVKGHIEPLPLKPEQQATLDKWGVHSFRYLRTPTKVLKFLLYAPDKMTPGREYPLLLFLHGMGGSGTDNFKQWMDAGETPKYFVDKGFQLHMPCYVMIPQSEDPKSVWESGGYVQPKPVLSLVAQAIDVMKISIAPQMDMKRLYLTGLSSGAYGCFDTLAMFPGKFAAAVPVSGGCEYARFNPSNARPVWMAFNRDDPAVF